MNEQIEQAYWSGFSIKCAEMGADAEALVKEGVTKQAGIGSGIGKLLAVAGPSLGLGYLGGRKHQKAISKEEFGIVISKLLQRQRETMKANLSKKLLGR